LQSTLHCRHPSRFLNLCCKDAMRVRKSPSQVLLPCRNWIPGYQRQTEKFAYS
ncbi:hypothetical protein VCHENC02_5107B, partial [Vibrio harveyi]